MVNKLKQLIPITVKCYFIYLLSSNRDNSFESIKEEKKIIVTLAADYGNLGDAAIAYAQTEFLERTYPEYKIVELPISETFSRMKALKNVCSQEDIITIAGGGNMGDLYPEIETCRQFIIKQFPGNKIVSFPQTIDFSKTGRGNRMLAKTIRQYSKHKNLSLIAREKVSYHLMKQYFGKNTISIAPDIVMSLDKTEPQFERHGILLCLRNDKEKLFARNKQEKLISRLEQSFADVQYYDTHIGKENMSVQERKLELVKIWEAFKKAKVVVTDRLHGMIFCYITKTPCVVFPNRNHKIKASFEWIKDCNYIRFCEDYETDTASQYINEMANIDQSKMDKPKLTPYFDGIARV